MKTNFIDRLAVDFSTVTDNLFPGLQNKNEGLHVLYRSVLHVLGSLGVITVGRFIFYISDFNVIDIFGVLLMVYVLYKEIYFDPRYYNQKTYKGIIDVISWLLPWVIFYV